uniref:Uncharacterized protein n=1 Tax=Ornithorhynchus anatinus TaxID=9258 RepID=A0A6I8NJ95_ORNAN
MWEGRAAARAEDVEVASTGARELGAAARADDGGGLAEVRRRVERLALLPPSDGLGLRRLEASVRAARRLRRLPTHGVPPMDSLLEDRCLYLRADEVAEGNCAEELLQNASRTVEEYFVAPPGTFTVVPSKDGQEGFRFRQSTRSSRWKLHFFHMKTRKVLALFLHDTISF